MPYTVATTFREPLVFFGYLAALTTLELVTGIVILPQRQTALVAKQAAEVDLLTEGRFRLGVGVGWNRLEYEVLGKDFTDRGRRMEEQIELLRHLWTVPSGSFDGRYESMEGAGIAPLPVQRPIPVWVGGASPAAYRRIGRLADGWFPMVPPDHRLDEALEHIATGAADRDRDPSTIGMEGRVSAANRTIDKAIELVERWRARGATHVTIDTMHAGFTTADEHVAVLADLAAGLGLAGR
jgi:probable F420-dependent oxidoreductase